MSERKRIGLREVRAIDPGQIIWDTAVTGFAARRQVYLQPFQPHHVHVIAAVDQRPEIRPCTEPANVNQRVRIRPLLVLNGQLFATYTRLREYRKFERF